MGAGSLSERAFEISGIETSAGGMVVNAAGNGAGVSPGDVYVVDRGNNRVEQFSASGAFIRAWGYDVVSSGQDNTGANEQQVVVIPASVTAGTFTLTVATGVGEGKIDGNPVNKITNLSNSLGAFRVGDLLSGEAVPANSTITAVEGSTLTMSNSSNSQRGRKVITASEKTAAIPFNAPASGPGSVQAAIEALPGVGSGSVSVSGGPGASATYVITFNGGPFAGNDIPQITATSSLTGGSASVLTATPGGGFEVCRAASSPTDVCKAGSASAEAGAMSAPQGIALEASTGNLYVTDQGNKRIDAFGANGSFQAAFGSGVVRGAAAGTGTLSTTEPGARTITAVTGTAGGFAVGQAISGAGIPAGARIVEVGAGTITLDKPVTASGTGVALSASASPGNNPVNERQTITLGANTTGGTFTLTFTTPAPAETKATASGIAYNATPLEVETKLRSLTNIGSGNVSVTSSNPGGVTGVPGGPYTVEFKGTRFADTNVRVLSAEANGLTISSGGKSVSVETVTEGASSLETCTVASTCIAATEGSGAGQVGLRLGYPAIAPTGAPDAGNLLVPDSNNSRIDEFAPTLTAGVVTGASFVRAFGWDTIPSGGAGDTGVGLEVCTSASGCKAGAQGGGAGQFSFAGAAAVAVDATGSIYTLSLPFGSSCSSSERCAVQKFSPAATSASDLAPAQLTFTSGEPAKQAVMALAVDPTTGDVYVSKPVALEGGTQEYRVLEFDSSGNPVDTLLTGAGIAKPGVSQNNSLLPKISMIKALAIDPTSSHLLAAVDEVGAQKVLILAETPSSVAETLTATLGSPAVTNITTSGATLHATVTPGQGLSFHTFYQFEYTNGSTWTKFPANPVDLGNGSGSGAPGTCPTNNPPSCEIELPVGLEPGQEYKVRLHAYVEYNPEAAVTTPYVKFTTLGVAPVAETGQAWWSSPASTTPNLMLTGYVTPKNEATSFYFQYVTEEAFLESGYEHASAFPPPPGDPAARSFNRVEVQQPLYELDSTKTYHYRLVAVNPTGTAIGADRTITPPSPTERFAELVSNGDSAALGIRRSLINAVSDNGSRVAFTAEIMDDPRSTTGLASPEIAQRTDQGWTVTPMAPVPTNAQNLIEATIDQGYYVSDDLSTVLNKTNSQAEARGSSRQQFFMSLLDGTARFASPVFEPIANEPSLNFGVGTVSGSIGKNERYLAIYGVSGDLSQFAFEVNRGENTGGLANGVAEFGGIALLPGEPLIPRANVIQVNTRTLQAELVNVDASGKPIGGVCGALLLGAHAISDDGSVTYFSVHSGVPYFGSCTPAVEAENGLRIFKRENGVTTTEISQSQCSRPALPAPPGPCEEINGNDLFIAASGDGKTVFFKSPRQLTNSDRDSASDLYVYDSDPPPGQPTLVQATAGEVTAGHPIIGSGSGFGEVLAVSGDGSRVYFTATGQLTSGAPASGNSIYVFERDAAHPTGRIAFVAKFNDTTSFTPAATDTSRQVFAVPTGMIASDGARSYGDGRFLFFETKTKVLPVDTDLSRDLYRYDDQTGEILCLSCAGNAESPVEVATASRQSQQGRIATEDGSRAVFTTKEALVPGDQNSVSDVYEWHEGELTLISGHTGSQGTISTPKISPDGKDVYFATEARLVASDVDTDAASDIYDTRIGGGFPAPKPEARICLDGEVCRGPTTSPPLLQSNESTAFSGPGNPAVSPRSHKCAKGKVRRHGKCVKRGKPKAGRKARGSK